MDARKPFRIVAASTGSAYNCGRPQTLPSCGRLNRIPLEELLQALLRQRVSSSQEVRAAGGRGVYQDHRVGLGGGGKPALSSLPSWALSAVEANLFPSDLWAKRQQQAWESFRESRGGRLHKRTCLCAGCTLQPPQHCLSPGRGSPAPLLMAADLSEFLHSQDNILDLVCTVSW